MPGPNTRRVSSLHTRNTARESGANHGQGAYPLLDSKIETACEESAQELSWVQEVSRIGVCELRRLETCRLLGLKEPTELTTKLTGDKGELFLKNVALRKQASNGKFTWTVISVEFDVSF